MPYDNSTTWAQYDNLNKVSAREVTPFLNELVNDQNSLYIPHVKGGSGITIKALFNMLLSLHSLSINLTHEHGSNFYHKCIPQVLKRAGNPHQLFAQPSKIVFDHKNEIIYKMCFEDTFT